MTRVFKPLDAAEQTAFVKARCRLCKLQLGCTLLADARPLDAFDADYPDELVYGDDGQPDCTAFQGPGDAEPDALPVVTARPVPPAPTLEVVSIQAATVARGLVDASKLHPGRRSFTVPFADVSALFDDGVTDTLRDSFGLPAPDRARVHRNQTGVTITARTARDGASVSSSVRLKIAARAR